MARRPTADAYPGPPRRALILSAPVGAGHDAAARGVAAELAARGYTVETDDGLALLGRWIERIVVDGYHLQLEHAPWSWRILYRVTRSTRLMRLVGSLLARAGGRRLRVRIAECEATLVVSTYPLVSAALAGLRRRRRLPTPCAAIVTDVDPHPAWIHRALDANLTVGAATSSLVAIQPPIAAHLAAPGARREVRGRLKLTAGDRVALIVGGAWGTGDLTGAAAACSAAGCVPIVVCGHNQALWTRLAADPALRPGTVVGFAHDLPELMAASDVLIQNAGGLTCLEAFRVGLAVVMYQPLPGHGEANAELLATNGLVTLAEDQAALSAQLAASRFWAETAPNTAGQARLLFDRPQCGELLAALAPQPAATVAYSGTPVPSPWHAAAR